MPKNIKLILKIMLIVTLFILIIYQCYMRIYDVYSTNYELYYYADGPHYQYEIKAFHNTSINSYHRIIYKNKQKIILDTLIEISSPMSFENISPPKSGYLIKDKNGGIFLSD